MANHCYNKVIIRHDDFSEVQDLYHVTSGDFFNAIKPYPLGLCGQENLKDKLFNLVVHGADNLTDWMNIYWSSERPYPETLKRSLSIEDSYLMLQFDTPRTPPIEIFEELNRQGFYLKSYFFSENDRFCGSFIDGVLTWSKNISDTKKIPNDIDTMFGVGYSGSATMCL